MVTIKGDTLICITNKQLIKINRFINDSEKQRDINKVLRKEIELSDSLIVYYKKEIAVNDSITRLQEERFIRSLLINEKIKEDCKKRQRRHTIFVGALATTVITIILLIK